MKAMPSLLLLLALLSSVHAFADVEPADFTLNDLSGTTIKLSDYRGHWVVVNFWASWCASCGDETKELIEFQKRYPRIRLLGINYEQQTEKGLRPYLSQFEMNYPQLLLRYTTLSPFEPLKGLPTTAIVNPDGIMVSKYAGSVTVDMLEAYFRKEGVIIDPKAVQAAKEAEEAKLAEEQAAREKEEAEAKAAAEAKEKEEREAKARAAAKAKAAKEKAAREQAARKAAREKAAAEAKAASEAKAAAQTQAPAAPQTAPAPASVTPAPPPPAGKTGGP